MSSFLTEKKAAKHFFVKEDSKANNNSKEFMRNSFPDNKNKLDKTKESTNNSIGIEAWQENRKKWLQKSNKSAEFSKSSSNEGVSREISAKDYAKIEQIIRSISSPYESLPKPIRLVDMVEILDDIWEEDDTY